MRVRPTRYRSCEEFRTIPDMTQAKKICRLGRGQSIGSRGDKFNAPPPQVSAASCSNQPFNAVNGRGSSDTHRPWHSKLRRGRVEFIAPGSYRLPPSQPANFLSLCHIGDRSNFSQLLPRGDTDLIRRTVSVASANHALTMW